MFKRLKGDNLCSFRYRNLFGENIFLWLWLIFFSGATSFLFLGRIIDGLLGALRFGSRRIAVVLGLLLIAFLWHFKSFTYLLILIKYVSFLIGGAELRSMQKIKGISDNLISLINPIISNIIILFFCFFTAFLRSSFPFSPFGTFSTRKGPSRIVGSINWPQCSSFPTLPLNIPRLLLVLLWSSTSPSPSQTLRKKAWTQLCRQL